MTYRVLISLFCLLLLTACEPTNFEDLKGNKGHFSNFKGDWLVINYWASWCKPCLIEIPELNTLDQQHPNIRVFAVNYDQLSPEELAPEAQAMGIEFTVLLQDPVAVFGYPQPTRLPTTVLVSPDGEVTEIREGLQTEAGLLAAMGLPH